MAGSTSQSSQNSSTVDAVQQKHNADLYGQAQNLANSQGNIQQIAQNALDPLYQDAFGAYDRGVKNSDFANSVSDGSNAGMQTLNDLQAGGPNPAMEAYYQSAMTGVNNNLQRNILPSVQAGAIGSGQSGSSRHGIAQGLAMSDANQQATDLAGQMYGQAYDADQGRRLQASQGYIDSGLGAEGQAATQASNVIGAAGQLYDMQLDPMSRAWDPLNSYKGIVGNQTILGSGSSKGSSWNVL